MSREWYIIPPPIPFSTNNGVTVAPLCGADSGGCCWTTAAHTYGALAVAYCSDGRDAARLICERASLQGLQIVDLILQHSSPLRGADSGVICTGTGGWSVWAFFRIPRALSRFSVSARRARRVC